MDKFVRQLSHWSDCKWRQLGEHIMMWNSKLAEWAEQANRLCYRQLLIAFYPGIPRCTQLYLGMPNAAITDWASAFTCCGFSGNSGECNANANVDCSSRNCSAVVALPRSLTEIIKIACGIKQIENGSRDEANCWWRAESTLCLCYQSKRVATRDATLGTISAWPNWTAVTSRDEIERLSQWRKCCKTMKKHKDTEAERESEREAGRQTWNCA